LLHSLAITRPIRRREREREREKKRERESERGRKGERERIFSQTFSYSSFEPRKSFFFFCFPRSRFSPDSDSDALLGLAYFVKKWDACPI
jgi:hypothetical protein